MRFFGFTTLTHIGSPYFAGLSTTKPCIRWWYHYDCIWKSAEAWEKVDSWKI